MIDLVANALQSNILDLPYIDRYGGVVRPVPIRVETEIEGQYVTKNYPIGRMVAGGICTEGEQSNIFEPNADFKSVSYLEQVETLASVRIAPYKYNVRENVWLFRERFRFVCWMNITQFSKYIVDPMSGEPMVDGEGNAPVEPYISTTRFELAALKAVVGKYEILAEENEGLLGKMKVEPYGVVRHSPREVFGRYEYSEYEWAFVYPYDFFAVEFETEILIPSSCIGEMEAGIPIKC